MSMSDFNFLNKQQTQQTPVHAPKTVATDDKQERTCFVNDLSPEEVDKAVEEYSKRIREQLSGETITVNCMSRLLNMSHPRTSALLKASASAKEALLDNGASKVARAQSLLSKLTPEQRDQLVKQLQEEKNC